MLLILQMGKLRLKKLSWHLNPSRSPWSPCSPPSVRVCVHVCAHCGLCCLLSEPGGVWAGMSRCHLGRGGPRLPLDAGARLFL